MIKNIDLITGKLKDFSFRNIKFIVGFFLSFESELQEYNSSLDIEFIIEDAGNQYTTRLRFDNPETIHFESGGRFHQIHLDITDIRSRGWENKNYEVVDYEDNRLHFYCSDVEVISVTETHYFI